MDRKIQYKGFLRRKYIPFLMAGFFLTVVVFWFVFRDTRTTLRVDRKSVNVVRVEKCEFSDYIRVNGAVRPMSTVQLTPLEAGIVDQKIVEEGAIVSKGQVIITLTNPQLNIQILESEASLAEKENFLRNTRVQMEQEKLNIRRDRLVVDMELTRKYRKLESDKALYADRLISREEYLQSHEEYELAVANSKLIAERQIQDSIFRALQIDNMELNLMSMQLNMKLIRERMNNLNIKSPINGELGMLDVALGQSIVSGQKLGQINDLSGYRIEAMIDEYYIDRISKGLLGTLERAGECYDIVVGSVFPEVRAGKFKILLNFVSERPDNIRTGQTYYVDLQLGSSINSLVVPRGAFYQSTGGNWIYVMDQNNMAVRRPIRIGKQNPRYFEILEGLNEGEQVIVNSYDSYGNNEVLKLI